MRKDSHKPHDSVQYWPDWYEIKWTDMSKILFDYGKDVLVQQRRAPDETKHFRLSDSAMLTNKQILLVGPFNFETKLHGIPANQIIPLLQWELLALECHEAYIVQPK